MTNDALLDRLGQCERRLQGCHQSVRSEFQEALDARDDARAAVLARMMPEWREIESAPEDGREVLATFQGQFGGWVSFIAYAHPRSHGGVQTPGYAKPTHWIPLPPPPVTDPAP